MSFVDPEPYASHETLQAVVYNVHEELRKKFKGITAEESDDNEERWLQAWQEHTENSQLLAQYSEAMLQLATKVWVPSNNDTSKGSPSSEVKCRIEWVMIKVREYFGERFHAGSRLKLLDVGSCYNPFSAYSDCLDVVPLDLCPAQAYRHVVYQGDFLKIDCDGTGLDGVIAEKQADGSKHLKQLSSNYFNLVVFSFFLEYLPSTKQRLESCRRAYDVLQEGGILFILRPDSNAVTPTCMKFVKELKVGLAYLGFKRIYCDKLQHLWGMGFVKLSQEEKSTYLASSRFKSNSSRVNFAVDNLDNLFRIPQDAKVAPPSSTPDQPAPARSAFLFAELPEFNSRDSD